MNYHKVLSFMNLWKGALSSYDMKDYDIRITDTVTGQNISVADLVNQYEQRIEKLENDIAFLKEENIETSNVLYELMNSIEALDARIDIVTAEKFLKDDNV